MGLKYDAIKISKKGGVFYMLQGIGTTELVIVALLLLVFFGSKKLPELARGLGDSIAEFRKAASESV